MNSFKLLVWCYNFLCCLRFPKERSVASAISLWRLKFKFPSFRMDIGSLAPLCWMRAIRFHTCLLVASLLSALTYSLHECLSALLTVLLTIAFNLAYSVWFLSLGCYLNVPHAFSLAFMSLVHSSFHHGTGTCFGLVEVVGIVSLAALIIIYLT